MTARTEPSLDEANLSNLNVREIFDPLSEDFRADPYRVYHQFRVQSPVHCAMASTAQKSGFWYLFRYADVMAVLKDPRFGREMKRARPCEALAPPPANRNAFYEMAGKWMLYRDPPDHTRLRSLVNKAFTRKTVLKLQPSIAALGEELLDAVEHQGHMDVIADFAFPLPLNAIARMLGVRPRDQIQFREWSNALSAAIDQNRTPGVYEAASQATEALSDYFREILAERRQQPQDDLMSGLIEAEEQGRHLSEDEVVATCILLLGAGQETTVDLIGNSLLTLLRNPTQMELLKNDPDMIAIAVEELLRFESPVQMTARIAFEDVEIGGHMIQRGDKVTLVLGAANRDPVVFPNPDSLDLKRSDRSHLSFGVGIHFCLGAPLAHAHARIALNMLLRRFPHLKLEDTVPQWRMGPVFRGLQALPVSF